MICRFIDLVAAWLRMFIVYKFGNVEALPHEAPVMPLAFSVNVHKLGDGTPSEDQSFSEQQNLTYVWLSGLMFDQAGAFIAYIVCFCFSYVHHVGTL
jgi:hypothetical protein